MDTTNLSNDYLAQYRAISSRIKKRFLRKPNIAEASEEFSKLARSLNDCEAWPQAGLCCLAVARCEQSLSNSATEVASMTEAALKFLKAEQMNQELLCHSYEEHLNSAISCFEFSFNLYKEEGKPALAASLALEFSQSLCALGKHSEALTYLQEASLLLCNSPLDYVTCLSFMTSCRIDLGDLDGALALFTKISATIKEYEGQTLTGACKEILTRCEICSLLLLLTLQPLSKQMKAEHSQLLEKYSSPDSMISDVPYDDNEMIVLLQSLVIACQTRDSNSVSALAEHLSEKLSGQALHLLHVLVLEMGRS